MTLHLHRTATEAGILTRTVLVHGDTSFIHCQACTAVRDFVLPLSSLQKYFVLNQTPRVMAPSHILLHRRRHVLEAGCSTHVQTTPPSIG